MKRCRCTGCKTPVVVKRYQQFGETREVRELSMCYKHLLYMRLYMQWRKKHGRVHA